jgi:iron complex outermembrane receptor protein
MYAPRLSRQAARPAAAPPPARTARTLRQAIACAAMLAACAAGTAVAEPAPAIPQGADEIQETTVTARRREESASDVPLALSVVDGDLIDNTASFNVGRLQQLQPSLQFYSSNPRNTAVNIRGIGAPFGLTNDGIEQGVGIYVDDVYYARVAASTFDFLDVAQIEVLRGPQGTLYGKNTTAGALNIRTRAPTFTPEGRVELSTGDEGYLQAKGALSGPLVDDLLAFRLVASSTKRNGLYYNVTTKSDVNEVDNLGVRAQLLWVPADGLDVTFAADYNRQDPECCAQVEVGVSPTLRAANRRYAALAAASGYVSPSSDPFHRRLANDTELRAEQDFGGASVRAVWELDAGTLTSVTAWRYWKWGPSNDRDFTGLPITTVSANPSEQEQWTQEFRFAGSAGDSLDYLVGAFAFRQTLENTGLQEQGASASLWLLGPTAGANPALLDGLRQETDIEFENDSYALFGQLTWHITDTLHLQPGLRINYDSKDADYNAVASGGLATTDPVLIARKNSVLQSQAYVADFEDTNVSGDLNLSWNMTDEVLVYALYAKSFKSGGVNLSGIPARANGTPATEVAEVDPEEIDHYELGAKTTLLGGDLTLNVALFRTDIHDYQATVVNGAVGVLRGYLANAEEVRTQGVEFDLVATPIEGLRLYVNGAYNDARFESFPDAPPPLELSGGNVQVVDISGQRLPGVSKWSGSYGAEYGTATTLFGATGELYAAIDGNYRSRWSSNPTPSRFMWVDSYAVHNLRAGFRADTNWSASLWVRNVFDTHYYDFLSQQSGATGLIVGQVGDPRSYGVSFSVNF